MPMEADFAFSTVHVHVPLHIKAAFLATLLYASWCLLTALGQRQQADGWFWQSEPALLSLMPLLFNVPVVWFSYARVAQGMSLSGSGRAALSAGLAEALLNLFVGAVTSTALAAILLVVPACHLVSGDHRATRMNGRLGWRSFTPLMTVMLFSVTGVVLVLCFAEHLTNNLAFNPSHEQAARAAVAISGAVVGGAAIFALQRFRKANHQEQSWLRLLYALLIVSCVGAGATIVIFRAIYRQIAVGALPAA